MLLQTGTFFKDSLPSESLELIERPDVHSNLIVLGLMVCVFLIAVARLRQREVFAVLFQGTFLFRSHADQLKDGIRENGLTIFLLLLQFICISSLSFYWINQKYFSSWSIFQQLVLLFFPIIVVLYTTILSWLTTRLTNRPQFYTELNHINVGVAQTSGLLFLAAFFVLFFKPEYKILGNLVILGTFGLMYFIRVLRSFYIGIQQGITWYYLILYLWTLEILPVLILAKLLFNEELMEIIG